MDAYALYLRKSRADIEAEKAGDGETLARHRTILTEYAKKAGLVIAEEYAEVVSGSTIADRPQIRRLIEDCYAGKYRGVVCMDIDRLSRGNQGDAQTIMDCLKYANSGRGLLICTPTKTYDINHNPDDETYIEFALFLSRQEYKMIRKRMERGRLQSVVEGNYMGSYRPYGYDIVKDKTGRTLTPRPDEADIVRNLYAWAIDGMSSGQIARKLNLLGVPAYRGGNWTRETIKAILTNPTYTGRVRWNDRMAVKKLVDGQLVQTRPRSNHTDAFMLYEGKHPRLVSDEDFDRASHLFHIDRTKSDVQLVNPLAGLLWCARCGRRWGLQSFYGARKTTTKPRYTHGESMTCMRNKSIFASLVMEAVTDALKGVLSDFAISVDNSQAANSDALQSQLNTVDAELKKARAITSKLFDAWEAGIIDNAEFVERKQLNETRIKSLEAELEDLKKKAPNIEDIRRKTVLFSEAIASLNNEDIPAKERNRLLKQLVKRITIDLDENGAPVIDLFLSD